MNSEPFFTELRVLCETVKTIDAAFSETSMHFYQRSLEWWNKEFLSERHLEYIYATLISWGMNRMGDPEKTKAKLVSFPVFQGSILMCKDLLLTLKEKKIEELSCEEFDALLKTLEVPFGLLRVSQSESSLVANAKTLHNLMPHLIPPIDRQYTLLFCQRQATTFRYSNRKGKSRWRSGKVPIPKEEQYELFRIVCAKLYSLQNDRRFKENESVAVLRRQFTLPLPKLLDDLIISFVKSRG